MDHKELLDSVILKNSKDDRARRDPVHPHASGALLCPRRNILQWLRLSTYGDNPGAPITINRIGLELRGILKPRDTIPGVFTAGHIYDQWLKDVYQRALDDNYPDLKGVEAGQRRIFILPKIPDDDLHDTPLRIAGEFDQRIWWGPNGECFDLIENKSTRSLFQYHKHGPSLHHLAQLGVYTWGIITELYGQPGDSIPTSKDMDEYQRKARQILIYIEKNSTERMICEAGIFPLKTLRNYFSQLTRQMSTIRTTAVTKLIEITDIPEAIPSFDWECRWKTGSCEFFEPLCKEAQRELKGTVLRRIGNDD